MKVIAGTLKGKVLKGPKNIRPVTSFIKEAIFNILQFTDWQNVNVLDIFAGAGNFGIEAISRGARRVVFIDLSKGTSRYINQNLRDLRWNGAIYIGDFRDVIKKLFKKGEKFNIIFADPPFDMGLGCEVLKSLEAIDILENEGILVLRVRDKEVIAFSDYWNVEKRQYGDSLVYFLKKRINAEQKPFF